MKFRMLKKINTALVNIQFTKYIFSNCTVRLVAWSDTFDIFYFKILYQ